MISYTCFNLQYDKHRIEKWVVVRGEIRNESDKSFNTAVFRLRLFIGMQPMGSAILKIKGWRANQVKPFEVMVEGAHQDLIPQITRCEITFESGF